MASYQQIYVSFAFELLSVNSLHKHIDLQRKSILKSIKRCVVDKLVIQSFNICIAIQH